MSASITLAQLIDCARPSHGAQVAALQAIVESHPEIAAMQVIDLVAKAGPCPDCGSPMRGTTEIKRTWSTGGGGGAGSASSTGAFGGAPIAAGETITIQVADQPTDDAFAGEIQGDDAPKAPTAKPKPAKKGRK